MENKLDNKRLNLLMKATEIFGDNIEGKEDLVKNKLMKTLDIDYVDYTDLMLRKLLNDIIFDKDSDNLFTKYIIPPFSIIDTRQGYWQQRKKEWLKITGNLTTTKEAVLSKTTGEFGVDTKGVMAKMESSSNFDPVLEDIYRHCINMLNDNRFLVIKVGEVRDKESGEYRGFVSDTIKILQGLGLKFYNDMILLNSMGTAPLRATNAFKNRKCLKLHQNILVFYKGNMNLIKDNYKNIDNRLSISSSENLSLF